MAATDLSSGRSQGGATFPARGLTDALKAAGPPLLFGLRLWASVSLALYVAFSLELDNPVWAGTSAAIVCQPHLGASLRKGWYRMIVGAIAIVVLTACFPQDRALFLGGLALWGGASALAATLLRNFVSYSAALAGYTAAIVGSDLLGATGGVNANAAFLLAVSRGSEIIIGIVCAGIVLAATDLGDAPRRLAALFAATASGIADRFTDTLTVVGASFDDTQQIRWEFVRRVIALDRSLTRRWGNPRSCAIIRPYYNVASTACSLPSSAGVQWQITLFGCRTRKPSAKRRPFWKGYRGSCDWPLSTTSRRAGLPIRSVCTASARPRSRG
jgi:hypothetical protein